MKKTLWWLLADTNGGKNRYKILLLLIREPKNAHELSTSLNMNYKTIRHHLMMLEKHGLVSSMGDDYGRMFYVSDFLEEHIESFNEVVGEIEKRETSNEVNR